MSTSLRDGAHLSDDGRFRYELTRGWGFGDVATFVMLNPSTADASVDDPTIRRCIGFAKSWGMAGLRVVNLYAIRATNPMDMRRAPDRVGPGNDTWLTHAAEMARVDDCPLVAAWGVHAEAGRVATVLELPGFDRLTALGVTKDGAPRHPLYLRADSLLHAWPAERAA